MSYHIISCQVISCHVMSCQIMSYHAMSCHVMSGYLSISLSLSIYIYIYMRRIYTCPCWHGIPPRRAACWGLAAAGSRRGSSLHPVRIARIHYPRFAPRVGLGSKEIRTLSALRISKGWVRKDPNLGWRTGCNQWDRDPRPQLEPPDNQFRQVQY